MNVTSHGTEDIGPGQLGLGVLAIWCDVDTDDLEQFSTWYREHLPERVGIPGFLSGRRYQAVGSPTPRFLTVYGTETLDVLASPAYLERLNNPTDLTRQTVPLLKNMTRMAYRVRSSTAEGIGGRLGVFELQPAEDGAGALRTWMRNGAFARLLEHPDIVGAHLCEPDQVTTEAKSKTAEGKAAMESQEGNSWLLLAEAASPLGLEALQPLLDDIIGAQGRVGSQAATPDSYQAPVTYQLMVTLAPPLSNTTG